MLVKIVNYVHTKCVNYAQNGTEWLQELLYTGVTDRKCGTRRLGRGKGLGGDTVNISGLFEVVALSQGRTALNRRLAI